MLFWLPVAGILGLVVVVGWWLTQLPTPRPTATVVADAVSEQPPVVEPTPGPTPSATTTAPDIDPDWLARTAEATGIPSRALAAYGRADLALRSEQPGCGISWVTLAAIGSIESAHGFHDGSTLGADGRSTPEIRGVQLAGRDTDAGFWDGDPERDRAMGPLQFIPDSWVRWGADGDGNGVADPDQIDDAALTAARYLCDSGSLADAAGWRAAVRSYNPSDEYVDAVAARATQYAEAARG